MVTGGEAGTDADAGLVDGRAIAIAQAEAPRQYGNGCAALGELGGGCATGGVAQQRRLVAEAAAEAGGILAGEILQGGGVIINNASISGMMGDYGMVVYNAAKGGVVNYTRALALDHAHENIRVNAICPGAIDTPLFAGIKAVPKLYSDWMELIPMGRIGQPEEIASVVAFLASDDASYMTGSIITIDGGQTSTTGTPNFNNYLDALKVQYN